HLVASAVAARNFWRFGGGGSVGAASTAGFVGRGGRGNEEYAVRRFFFVYHGVFFGGIGGCKQRNRAALVLSIDAAVCLSGHGEQVFDSGAVRRTGSVRVVDGAAAE